MVVLLTIGGTKEAMEFRGFCMNIYTEGFSPSLFLVGKRLITCTPEVITLALLELKTV